MMGKLVPYRIIPFFWTRNYNKNIQLAGNAESYDEVYIQGDFKDDKFLAYYIKDNKI